MEVMMILGAVKAVGSVIGGIEENANLKATEPQARLNAQIARDDAANELRVGTADADASRRKSRKAVAEQITGFAQSGFAISDSADLSIGDSAEQAELDAMNIMYKGTLRNRAGLAEAASYDNQAESARRSRKALPIKTAIGAATNLLSGYTGKGKIA